MQARPPRRAPARPARHACARPLGGGATGGECGTGRRSSHPMTRRRHGNSDPCRGRADSAIGPRRAMVHAEKAGGGRHGAHGGARRTRAQHRAGGVHRSLRAGRRAARAGADRHRQPAIEMAGAGRRLSRQCSHRHAGAGQPGASGRREPGPAAGHELPPQAAMPPRRGRSTSARPSA